MTEETALHVSAKVFLQQAQRVIHFRVACECCQCNTASHVALDFRDSLWIELERDVGRYRVDVAVIDVTMESMPVAAAVEVMVTHAVPHEKWRDLDVSVLVEARASDIMEALEHNRPVEAIRIRNAPLVCDRCRLLLTMRLDFGMHRGSMLCQVPAEYFFSVHRRHGRAFVGVHERSARKYNVLQL
jgi:hypothetical protein